MAEIILIKHGQTDWDRQNRVRGSLDIPLNEEGKKDAQRVSDGLLEVKIGAVYSGPAACCFSTASEIALKRNIKVKKVKALGDLDQGAWQGLVLDEVKKRYRKQYNAWKTAPASVRPPNGESVREGYGRAISALRKIIGKHKEGTACIVCGPVVFCMIKCYLSKIDLNRAWELLPKDGHWETFDLSHG